MVRKRLDDRVRTLLERSVVTGQRSILVLVGDHGRDRVPNLYQILTKTSTNITHRPKVLWCYKKELGFSTHRKKRMKKLQRQKERGLGSSTSSGNSGNKGDAAADQADNFELFISQADINWCYYRDSHRVLGTTVGMLILQDFEALTPNLLARTIETVAGGGLIIFLLRTVQSLKQLYAMTMDVHSRYRTESAGDVVPRFNERFILSLARCENCLVCDDELNVLPVSRKALRSLQQSSSSSSTSTNSSSSSLRLEKGDAGEVIVPTTREQEELDELKKSLLDTPHVGALVELAKTLDQAKALLVFLEACSEKTNKSTVALTAARGRGKSAALGLCLAGAISLGYSNICLTAPEPENLIAVFDFVCRGLHALKYQQHMDYTLTYNTASAGREATKCIISVQIHRTHRQLIQYILPQDVDKFSSAEIVAIDEAAAIPLPIVRALMRGGSQGGSGDRLTFLSSTVNGYEGTGRALSLKLIKELREAKMGRQAEMQAANAAAGAIVGAQSKKGDFKVHEQRWAAAAAAVAEEHQGGGDKLHGPLREIELTTPIRYAAGDAVESWLNKLLCLDSGSTANLKLSGGAPAPGDCELYSVDRDALFSYHKLSESFLQKLMGLYTSAHYKNTPNDLQMLSDAPSHGVFVLLSPMAEQQDETTLPDILAVIQVAMEGRISRKAVEAQLARGHRSAGDLIPWTISQQFGDSKFAQLSGARIVRVAVHPSVQGMGYGSRAMELLYRFYDGEMMTLMNHHSSSDNDDGDDDDDEKVSKEAEGSSQSESDDGDEEEESATRKKGIRGEKLTPRNELPPLLLPLTEVDAPNLDWIGTSFGLTLPLHKFWARAGMRMLYLRQTKNELTGEHSAIMVRALPKRTGVNDSWLPAFCSDTRRRFVALLGGPFRHLDSRLSLSVLEGFAATATQQQNQDSKKSQQQHYSATMGKITADELDVFLTPHDLKRLELYGRNLCDHHLVSDLLSTIARLYFTGRFGPNFGLSSVQEAILCAIGLQNRTVDSLTAELGLPGNQVLAMFNKTVRKVSIALNSVVEEKEKKALLSGDKREKAEQTAAKMRHVAEKTLDEDMSEAVLQARETLKLATLLPEAAAASPEKKKTSNLPPEIARNSELSSYVVKGSDEQWSNALKDKELDATTGVRIQSVREKRKAVDEDDMKREQESTLDKPKQSGAKKNKKSRKKSSGRR
jgi:N-acetyltransferase 10